MNTLRMTAAIACLCASFIVADAAHAATAPKVTSASVTAGKVSWAIGKSTYSVRPWGSSYTGTIMAKKITFGTTVVVLTVAQAAGGQPEAKLYSSTAKLIEAIRPFYGTKYGYNTSIVVQPNLNKVFVAFGTKKAGASARIMEVTKKSLVQVNNPTVAKTADKGEVLVQFLKLYAPNYGLATMIAGKPSTLKVWKYSNATHRFDEDTSTAKSRIVILGKTLSL